MVCNGVVIGLGFLSTPKRGTRASRLVIERGQECWQEGCLGLLGGFAKLTEPPSKVEKD